MVFATGFQLLVAPGSGVNGTVCEGINNARQVVCEFTDEAGTGHAFIASPPEVALADLLDEVTGVGPGKSLEAKVMAAQTDFAGADIASTCSDLSDLVSEVNAQTGKKIGAAVAGAIIANTAAIETALGCP